jgi:hypothetical protein
MEYRKKLTESDLLGYLADGKVDFPPLTIMQPVQLRQGRDQVDATLQLAWGQRKYAFAVECKSLWYPKAIKEAIAQLKSANLGARFYPLVLAPYLPENQLSYLEAEGVSGLDLCGNGVIVVPYELLVYRTGRRNLFRAEGSIKNVYRRNSSIVARLFLLKPDFETLSDALVEIQRLGGNVTIGTVSKVCKALEDDLVLERWREESLWGRRLRLLQPEKLLDSLADNYEPPEINATFTGKTPLTGESLQKALASWEKRTGGQIVRTGLDSVEAYATMARQAVQSYYCSDLQNLLKALKKDVEETARFSNVSFLETRDEFVYFDRRAALMASPLQTYLELIAGDKRERETAAQVRRVILAPLSNRPEE